MLSSVASNHASVTFQSTEKEQYKPQQTQLKNLDASWKINVRQISVFTIRFKSASPQVVQSNTTAKPLSLQPKLTFLVKTLRILEIQPHNYTERITAFNFKPRHDLTWLFRGERVSFLRSNN